MKNKWVIGGLLAALALPTYAQEKEEERVEHSGTVMKEILNAPDSIPQSVLDKAVVRQIVVHHIKRISFSFA